MIENDIPVPLTSNMMKEECLKTLNKNELDEAYPKMYENKQMDNGICSHEYKESDKLFESHCVTVTGIVIDGVTNEEDNKIWLRVSSWGKSYYIKYKKYISYMEKYAAFGNICTNLIYVEKK